MMNKIKYFAGIDVQIKRGCFYYILDENKTYVTSGWIKENIPQSFINLFLKLTNNNLEQIAIGIDAPRMPIKKLRKRSFNKKTNSWFDHRDEKLGRECEVIIKSYNIANPQWTRTLKDSPDWMQLGFSIFDSLKDFSFVNEVFPSASYKMMENENVKYELCLNEFNSGVKDMLDASVAALTVFEFVNGQGCEVGGDDGLGTIVLPRKILL
jgi:predicted nuclease with RNAse H fold